MINILLVEDHLLVREAWKDTLSKQPNIKVVAEADNIQEAYGKVLQFKPDIILSDIHLRMENGVDFINQVMNTVANPKIIVVSMNDEYSFIKKMCSLGVRGYVTKFSPQSDLIDAINKVSAGEIYLCSVAQKLFTEKSLNPEGESNVLSLRELDIMKLVSKGLGNKEIAQKLDLSIKTVEAHKTKIYKKLGLKSISELITYGKTKGMDF